MTDDIVTRLRVPLPYNLVGMTTTQLGDERRQAADEIERLRAENKALETGYLVIQKDRQRLYALAEQAVRGE